MRETLLDRLRRGPYRRLLNALTVAAARVAHLFDELVRVLSQAAGRAGR